MSAKYFCDMCGNELVEGKNKVPKGAEQNFRLQGKYCRRRLDPTLSFEIMTGRGNLMNSGDWCKYCIIDAVNSLDDRPQQAKEQT